LNLKSFGAILKNVQVLEVGGGKSVELVLYEAH